MKKGTTFKFPIIIPYRGIRIQNGCSVAVLQLVVCVCVCVWTHTCDSEGWEGSRYGTCISMIKVEPKTEPSNSSSSSVSAPAALSSSQIQLVPVKEMSSRTGSSTPKTPATSTRSQSASTTRGKRSSTPTATTTPKTATKSSSSSSSSSSAAATTGKRKAASTPASVTVKQSPAKKFRSSTGEDGANGKSNSDTDAVKMRVVEGSDDDEVEEPIVKTKSSAASKRKSSSDTASETPSRTSTKSGASSASKKHHHHTLAHNLASMDSDHLYDDSAFVYSPQPMHDLHVVGSELDQDHSSLPWRHDGNRLRRVSWPPAPTAGSPAGADDDDSVEPPPRTASRRKSTRTAVVRQPVSPQASPSSPAPQLEETFTFEEPRSYTAQQQPTQVVDAVPDIVADRRDDASDNRQRVAVSKNGSTEEDGKGFDALSLQAWNNYFDSMSTNEKYIYFGVLAATSYIAGFYAGYPVQPVMTPSEEALIGVVNAIQQQTLDMSNFVNSVMNM
jgi:hypothetical protein